MGRSNNRKRVEHFDLQVSVINNRATPGGRFIRYPSGLPRVQTERSCSIARTVAESQNSLRMVYGLRS